MRVLEYSQQPQVGPVRQLVMCLRHSLRCSVFTKTEVGAFVIWEWFQEAYFSASWVTEWLHILIILYNWIYDVTLSDFTFWISLSLRPNTWVRSLICGRRVINASDFYGYNAVLRIEQRVKCGSECGWKSAHSPLARVAYWALTNHASVTLRSWKNASLLHGRSNAVL